jgi:hypothetical protein
VLRRTRLTPFLLLLAMMVSPVAGTSRPIASLRLVVGIACLNDLDDQVQSPAEPASRRQALPGVRVDIGCAPNSRPLGAVFSRHRFQRPPPSGVL